MTTVPVLELVGQNVAGWRAQVNQEPRDELEARAAGWRPMWRVLKTVELRQERAGGEPEPWVYWTWEPDNYEGSSYGGLDCGYGGMTVELAREQAPCLVLDDPA